MLEFLLKELNPARDHDDENFDFYMRSAKDYDEHRQQFWYNIEYSFKAIYKPLMRGAIYGSILTSVSEDNFSALGMYVGAGVDLLQCWIRRIFFICQASNRNEKTK